MIWIILGVGYLLTVWAAFRLAAHNWRNTMGDDDLTGLPWLLMLLGPWALLSMCIVWLMDRPTCERNWPRWLVGGDK
jgi:hypothetical protein